MVNSSPDKASVVDSSYFPPSFTEAFIYTTGLNLNSSRVLTISKLLISHILIPLL